MTLPAKLESLPPEVEREQGKTRRRLVVLGAGLFVALRSRQREVVRGSSRYAGPSGTAATMATELAAVVLEFRTKARAAGQERLVAELEAVNVPVASTGSAAGIVTARSIATAATDDALARRAVRGTVQEWIKRVTSAEPGAARMPTFQAAARKSAPRLELVAKTETSTAFNAERTEAAARIRSHVEMMRVWDATLDKRTCPTCDGLDGTMVPLGSSFRGGSPGNVHPGCRCVESFVPVEFIQS